LITSSNVVGCSTGSSEAFALGRLQGIALEKLAIQLGIPPSTVHDIEKRAARRMLEKMEPTMAMIDFGFNAAGKDQSPARRRVVKPR
jgi:hypothetical protein